MTRDHEIPYENFFQFKEHLVALGFTLYEFNVPSKRLPSHRQVLLTHRSFRDEAHCTIDSVSRVFTYPIRGHTELINAGDVSFVNQPQDGARRPAILQTCLSSTSQAVSGSPQARCVGLANVASQQPMSEAKHNRQSVQDVCEDVGGVRHKRPRSSSSIAVQEFYSSAFDAARSSGREQLDFDQSQMVELSSSIETASAFHYTPDAAGPIHLPLSVSDYRPMEYDEMTLNQRDRSIRNSGPQQVISGVDESQTQLGKWSEIVSAFDNTPNVPPSVSDCHLTEGDEMSLEEKLQFICTFLDL